ncbi:BQ2448_3572 [Microbotryum intermedium]|uniref:BQ2448_3572 protein n=1 Tax=Microbotryum intermedium TaxID=269621 RepID=A0A238FAD0_9BASI|nr:BQ2448_3572 [Microbotryum intermedium]
MSFSFGTPAATANKIPDFTASARAASTPTATPSLFGSAPTSTPAPTGGLFGATPTSTAGTTGSLFGGFGATTSQAPATPAGGGLFGGSTTGAGMFGASSTTTSQAPATTSLFGQQQSTTTTPGLFGASTSAATPGGSSLFGATSQPGATSSLFGASTAPAGQSLFGQSQQAPSFSFGASNQAQQQANNAAQPAVTAAPLFGQSQSAATASLFGSKSASSSLFASNSTFGVQPNPAVQPQPPMPKLGDPYPPPNPNERPIESRIEAIKSAWDPQDPKCRFQTYFYNEPAPLNNVKMYGRPPQGTDEKAWQKAVRENPDPEKLVPAIAIGFAAIQTRIESQQKQALAHQALLGEIRAHLSELSSTHSLVTSLRTLRATQTATALQARILALVAKVSALTPSRNASVRSEEDAMRVRLESMAGDAERAQGRANELWSGVGAVKARKQALAGEREWAVVDEEGLRQVLEILASQQAGLDHLTKTLQNAAGDVEVINEAFGLSTRSPSSVNNTLRI